MVLLGRSHLLLFIRVVVLPPVMFLLESENISDLAVTQWRLPLVHLPCNGCIRGVLLQELFRRERSGNSVICRVEDLEA